MAYKSLGRDAVNKNTKPIQFIPREKDDKMVSFTMPYHQYEKLKEYASSNGLKVSQLCRYALSKEMNS